MLGIEIHYKGAHPLRRRDWNREVAEPTLRDAGEFWHNTFLRKHFTEAGAQEYRYIKRKGEGMARGSKEWKRSYTGRKFQRFGHTRPLVFSGEGERLARVRDVRTTSKRVRVVLPNKFNFRHPKSKIRMRDELTAISSREEQAIVARADQIVHRMLGRIRNTERKKLT
jgi:hypothetical protein